MTQLEQVLGKRSEDPKHSFKNESFFFLKPMGLINAQGTCTLKSLDRGERGLSSGDKLPEYSTSLYAAFMRVFMSE